MILMNYIVNIGIYHYKRIVILLAEITRYIEPFLKNLAIPLSV